MESTIRELLQIAKDLIEEIHHPGYLVHVHNVDVDAIAERVAKIREKFDLASTVIHADEDAGCEGVS
jgi:hypothetical protein